MALALNNLQRVDMPLNKETKPKHSNIKRQKYIREIDSDSEVNSIFKKGIYYLKWNSF